MKIVGHIGLILTIAFLTFISCTEEDIQAEGIESFITLKFINQTKLLEVRAEISGINSKINSINARIAAIDTADNRTELQPEKDSLNVVKSGLEVNKTKLSGTRSDINNGNVQVDSIVGISTQRFIYHGDSSTSYVLPINTNSTFSSYKIVLNTRADTLELSYELTTKFIENQLRAIASGIQINNSTYDSIKVACKDSICRTNEAELTIYF